MVKPLSFEIVARYTLKSLHVEIENHKFQAPKAKQ